MMAVGHRRRRRAEHFHCRYHRLGVAVRARYRCTAAAGGMVTRDPECRLACPPRAIRGRLPAHEPRRSAVFTGLLTDKSQANEKRVDDPRSAADVGARGAATGLVAVAVGIGNRLGAHPGIPVGLWRTRGCHCRPRHFDPALRRASLIGQRQSICAVSLGPLRFCEPISRQSCDARRRSTEST
jgi:hypothetical protein